MQMKYNAYVSKTVNLHSGKSSQKLHSAYRRVCDRNTFNNQNTAQSKKKINCLRFEFKRLMQEADALVSFQFGT